jgi:hypothetical protein
LPGFYGAAWHHRQKGGAVPRFNVQVEFGLETSISPEGVRFDEPDGVEDYEDSSYLREEPVECYGGSIAFTVEAENEDEAEEASQQAVYEGMEAQDDSGITWTAVNVRTEIEKIEVPMTLDRAKDILTNLISSGDDEEVREAVEFVFDALVSMDTRLSEATQRIAGLVARVEQAEAATTPSA